MEEGKVASFLLATSGVAKLRDSIIHKKNLVVEVSVFYLKFKVFITHLLLICFVVLKMLEK